MEYAKMVNLGTTSQRCKSIYSVFLQAYVLSLCLHHDSNLQSFTHVENRSQALAPSAVKGANTLTCLNYRYYFI